MTGLLPRSVLAQSLLDERTTLFQWDIPLPPWAVILLLLAAGLGSHLLLRTALRRGAARTASTLDDVLVDITAKAVPFWVFLSILWVAVEIFRGSDGRFQAFGNRVVGVGFIVSLFWFVTALLLRTMANWSRQNGAFQPVYPPMRFILRAVMSVVAVLTVLNYLGVEVGPLLATLGVGGLAVALALRDTLENFFAGLHIMADRPIAEGDVILVHETGDRGTVLKVGWRSTRIRTAENNVLVVPNVKLSSGIVTNMSALEAAVHVRFQVGVAYGSDADRVREVLQEEMRASVGAVPGVAAEPAPAVWLHPGFGPSSLDYTIQVAVKSVDLSLDVQDELRRRLLRRLKAEGITIPFPTTTVEFARKPRP